MSTVRYPQGVVASLSSHTVSLCVDTVAIRDKKEEKRAFSCFSLYVRSGAFNLGHPEMRIPCEQDTLFCPKHCLSIIHVPEIRTPH